MSPFAEKCCAKAIGHGKALVARAKQDLGRAERAGGEHNGLGFDRAQGRIGLLGRREMHPPMAPLPRDAAHGELGEDLRAMRLGVGKIGQGDGILGADIAARAAIAAKRAGKLLDAGRIDGVLEADHDGSWDRGLAEAGARRLKSAIFGEV